ncbi:hypothetical protein [Borreliella garinii]|uniref:hypothetical protein n=1 Tax=Borreliella garinii TaxID=29519 RepID=UPI000417C419|nr:hypothetical protein [Borreliella garinii]
MHIAKHTAHPKPKLNVHPPHQESLRLAHQIAEIYAGFASSRDIEHKVGDGLSQNYLTITLDLL